MNCLVTGGAGFIGSNLSLELERLGHTVTVLDNFLKGNRKNLDGFSGDVIEGDESYLESTDKQFDVIFHQAAITDTTVTDREEMFSNNVEGFKKILAYVAKTNCKLVYASSAATYGDGPQPMTELQDMKPLNVYAESKLEMDTMAAAFEAKNTIVGLKYFNVFGPRESFKGKMASMILQLANQIKAGNKPRVFEHGEQTRDHVYVKDIVGMNIKALEHNGFGLFNAATGTATSFNDLISFVQKSLGTSFETEYFKNPFVGAYQDHTIANMEKTKSDLGYTPQWTVEAGVADYMQWLEVQNE